MKNGFVKFCIVSQITPVLHSLIYGYCTNVSACFSFSIYINVYKVRVILLNLAEGSISFGPVQFK